MRIAGEERFVAAEDAGLYRDALGAVPPGGLPAAFLEEVEEPLRRLVRRYARTHGPFTTGALSSRYGVDAGPVLRELERAGELVQGELRPGGSAREWCDPEVLRRLRRASLASLRKEVEPAEQRALARFLPAWQGIDSAPPGGAGVDRLRELLVPLQGVALEPKVWERDVLPRRLGAYSPAWMDQLCASGELVWVGAGSLGRSSGRVALLFREDAPLARRAAAEGRSAGEPLHGRIRERLAGGAAFWTDLLADLGELEPLELQEALWDLVWAGEITNDAFAPLRAPRLSLAKPGREPGRRFARRRRPGAPQVQGRWSLTAPLFAEAPRARAAHARDRGADAGALRDRHSRDRAGRGRAGRLRGALRRAVEPRDARHRAARLLRGGPRRRAVRALGGDRAAAHDAHGRARRPARARGHRPGQPLRRHARRGPSASSPPAGAPRAWRAPTS